MQTTLLRRFLLFASKTMPAKKENVEAIGSKDRSAMFCLGHPTRRICIKTVRWSLHKSCYGVRLAKRNIHIPWKWSCHRRLERSWGRSPKKSFQIIDLSGQCLEGLEMTRPIIKDDRFHTFDHLWEYVTEIFVLFSLFEAFAALIVC